MLTQVMPGGVIVGGGVWLGTWLGVSGAAGLAVWALAKPAIMPSRMVISTRTQSVRKAMTESSCARRHIFPLPHHRSVIAALVNANHVSMRTGQISAKQD